MDSSILGVIGDYASKARIARRGYFRNYARLKEIHTAYGDEDALIGMKFSEEFHPGFRKDGVTPDHDHPISAALVFAEPEYREILIKGNIPPGDLSTKLLMHDSVENKRNMPSGYIEARFSAVSNGKSIAKSAQNLSRYAKGQKLPDETYNRNILRDPVDTMVKIGDIFRNVSTIDALPLERQVEKLRDYQIFIMMTRQVFFYPAVEKLVEEKRQAIEVMIDRHLKSAELGEVRLMIPDALAGARALQHSSRRPVAIAYG